MCFRKKDKNKKKEKKSKEDIGTDVMDKGAGKVPGISVPYEITKGIIKGNKGAFEGVTDALDEITDSIKKSKNPDLKKIKEGGQVDKKIIEGIKEGAESAGKGILDGILDGIKDLWNKIF